MPSRCGLAALCSRVESNHDHLLRREVFYPLNYESFTMATSRHAPVPSPAPLMYYK